MKIVADQHIPYVNDYFSQRGELILKPGRAISHDDVKEADILLVRSITRVDEALLSNTRVKFVGSVTSGADHLDTRWLDAAGIVWQTAAGFNAPPVADYVVSVIAALQRKGLLSSPQKRAAVIGMGNIGRLVAERFKLLQFDVVQCDPYRAEAEAGFVSVPLDALADLDVISLHVPLTHDGLYPTHHFIDAAFMARQKLGCVLLNASRGAVVDSAALMQAGAHLHWCFDVWESEPNIDQTILENTLIATPHIAGYSVQSKRRGIEMIYQSACKQGLMTASNTVLSLPSQQLTFAGDNHHWQDIVLGVFNPLVMTAMMRETLLASPDVGQAFDAMRHAFQYRHEFAFTTIAGVHLSMEDQSMIEQLGVNCSVVTE